MNTRADFLSCSTPLTEAQEGLWNMQARDPRNPILNTGLYLDLQGALDSHALTQRSPAPSPRRRRCRCAFWKPATGRVRCRARP